MRDFTFAPDVLDLLRYERYPHPHPRVQQKMEVIGLKSQGLTHDTIAQLAGLSRRSVQRYLDEYLASGIDRLYEIRWKGKHCPLDDFRTTIEEYFVEHPPRTVREARDAIERLTGIRRSRTQVREFLKKSGPRLAEGRGPPRQGGCRRTVPLLERGTRTPLGGSPNG